MVPPIVAPAMTPAEGTLLLRLLSGVAVGGVAAPVDSTDATVNTRVLDITTSVDEKTPDEISIDETIVLYSTTVEMMDVTILVGSGVDAGTVGVGVGVGAAGVGVLGVGVGVVGVGVVGVGVVIGDGGVTVTTTVTRNYKHDFHYCGESG